MPIRNRNLGRSIQLDRKCVLFDIGPAIGSIEAPASTTLDIARAFPRMDVICIDQKRAVEQFRMNADRAPQQQVGRQPNLTVVAGDGLSPLLALSGRRMSKQNNELVIVRAANSVDIYCSKSQNADFVQQTAADFKRNPVLLFYNRTILTKRPGSTDWNLIGCVSKRGFNHRTRRILPYGPGFPAPYHLYPFQPS